MKNCSQKIAPSTQGPKHEPKGLQIFSRTNLSKIQCWSNSIGKDCKTLPNLCPNLELDWDCKFRLLGIDFDNNLDLMTLNFEKKIQDIKHLLNTWIYRSLSVYGKIVVIKTLALSKLSHLALVLPNLSLSNIKSLESLFAKFLWGNKPAKVKLVHAKVPEQKGGLGFPDVKMFWNTLEEFLNQELFGPIFS